MEEDRLHAVSSDGCDCCRTPTDVRSERLDCSQKNAVFTFREQVVLENIRELSQRARALKAQMQLHRDGTPGDSNAGESAARELEALRQQRAELEKERLAAAEERMRLLGHA